jgi:hypothetical protein
MPLPSILHCHRPMPALALAYPRSWSLSTVPFFGFLCAASFALALAAPRQWSWAPWFIFLHLIVTLPHILPAPALLCQNACHHHSCTLLNGWLLCVLLSSVHHLASLLLSIIQSVVRTMITASMPTRQPSWLGIPIFGSNFWDPHWRRISDSVYNSEDSGRIFFWIPISGEPENWNSDLRFSEFRQFLAQELSTSFCC